MKQIAIYSRKSIETDKGDSINNQIKIVKEYFKTTECNFLEFQDEGFSGGNTNRPDFQRMMNLVRKKQINTIAVYRLDRIARNIVDFVNFYDELKQYNIELVSVTEGFDFSNHMGKLVMMILATFADMERESIKQRVKDNMRELAKTGKFSGGSAPWGYKIERVIENDKECSYLKLEDDKKYYIEYIFNLYLKEQSQHKVSKILKDQGINISRSSIMAMLTSPTYVKSDSKVIDYFKNNNIEVYGDPNGYGFLSYNKRPRYANNIKSWNSSDMFYAVSKHEAVITSDLFLEVQRLFKGRSQNPRPKESQFTYMGNVYCNKCSSKMKVHGTTKGKDNKWAIYSFVCTGKIKDKDKCDCKNIKIDLLHDKVLRKIQNITLDKKVFKSLLKTDQSDFSNELTEIKNRIIKNDKMVNNLVDKLMLLSNSAATPITKKIEELTKETESLRNELLNLESKSDSIILVDDYYNSLKKLYKVLNTSVEIEHKRKLFMSLISKVIYDDVSDDVFIKLSE